MRRRGRPRRRRRCGCGSTTSWIEATGAALESGERRGGPRRPRRRHALRRLLLGRQHDQGAPHRPPPQPRDRQRDRRLADPGRGPGRAPQPDLRRRPQHGGGDGRRRQQRPRPAGRARRRREGRPLRRLLLRRICQGRPQRRQRRRRRRGLGRPRVGDVQRQSRRADACGCWPATSRRWNCGRRPAPGWSPASARPWPGSGSPSTR